MCQASKRAKDEGYDIPGNHLTRCQKNESVIRTIYHEHYLVLELASSIMPYVRAK